MKTALLAAIIVIGTGCGIKGPPLPPLETVNDRENSAGFDEPATAAEAASGDITKKTSGDNTTVKKAKSK